VDNNLETFLLFYTAFHEGEMTIKEMRAGIVSEIGEEGLTLALVAFREARQGLTTTYYEAHKT